MIAKEFIISFTFIGAVFFILHIGPIQIFVDDKSRRSDDKPLSICKINFHDLNTLVWSHRALSRGFIGSSLENLNYLLLNHITNFDVDIVISNVNHKEEFVVVHPSQNNLSTAIGLMSVESFLVRLQQHDASTLHHPAFVTMEPKFSDRDKLRAFVMKIENSNYSSNIGIITRSMEEYITIHSMLSIPTNLAFAYYSNTSSITIKGEFPFHMRDTFETFQAKTTRRLIIPDLLNITNKLNKLYEVINHICLIDISLLHPHDENGLITNVQLVNPHRYAIVCWLVDDEEVMKLCLSKGGSGFISNDPIGMLHSLQQLHTKSCGISLRS